MLRALREAGLTANPKKSHLGLRDVDYLGYTIGRECVRPQLRKVEAIREWLCPPHQNAGTHISRACKLLSVLHSSLHFASETGVGVVLSQLQGDEEHPVTYISRKLLPREQKYSISDHVGSGNAQILFVGTALHPGH